MLKPVNDFILIIPEGLEEKTDSGIILVEKRSDVPCTGIVVDPGTHPTLKKDMKVWFKMWAGEDVTYKGTKYKLIHPKDLIASEGGDK